MLCALLLGLLGLTPGQVDVRALPFEPKDWARDARQVTVTVKEGEAPVTYTGVPLCHVLRAAKLIESEGAASMGGLRELTDAVVVLKARDGYQVAVSAAEVGIDKDGKRYLLAFIRNGEPLPEAVGPAKLIVVDEEPHVRWIRMVNGIDLVRLPRPAPPKAER
jgi:DMSO/TMAO reductase YedYZ molybdopterin-dependent catalytic subunit